MASPRAVSLRAAITKQRESGLTVHDEDIHHILLRQHPELREELQQMFPHRSFHQALQEEDFDKSEIPLSKVHYIKKLLSLGDSVCRLLIGDERMGTGFVLFGALILTNAHLLKDMFVEGSKKELSVAVTAQFNYEDPSFTQQPTSFQARLVVYIDYDMDYAILWFDESGQTMPPGLLKHFGPTPKSGEVCIIGHPGGDVKKIDLTYIIRKEERQESVDQKLVLYGSKKPLILQQVQGQGIDQIMTSDHVITYDTFMLHGSSGSPLFDAECRLVGLHSAGFVYGFPEPKDRSVIEFARPVLDIFKNLVSAVVFQPIKDNAQGNPHLEAILRETPLYRDTQWGK